ncbi:MAG TPA: 3-deoxy-manno-octulosonate cytidylyltransferase [Chiayiivirga sp.]|nr:3-deoxy-manno-octulosonate cytidylyltransferase [Chiayiivirga sp.]
MNTPVAQTIPEFVVAIPARYGSTRLPAKALRLIAGEPMIVHVARRALEAGAAEVVVATDDARIIEAVTPLGLRAVMTSAQHTSGTDRLAECAALCGWSDDRIVVNLQGDEPLAPPSAIQTVAVALARSGAPIATLAQALDSTEELFDPNCVKLVRSAPGLALYFSRAPIPWHRDHFAKDRLRLPTGPWLRHIGLYAYSVASLRVFAAMPPGVLEQVEALEQLRALEAGWSIAVALSPEPFPAGVDTEADLERVDAALRESRSA